MTDISHPDGGSAFPLYDYGNAGKGMTQRDWFAGQALAGLCSNSSVIDSGGEQQVKFAVHLALEIADCMLRSVPAGHAALSKPSA